MNSQWQSQLAWASPCVDGAAGSRKAGHFALIGGSEASQGTISGLFLDLQGCPCWASQDMRCTWEAPLSWGGYCGLTEVWGPRYMDSTHPLEATASATPVATIRTLVSRGAWACCIWGPGAGPTRDEIFKNLGKVGTFLCLSQ